MKSSDSDTNLIAKWINRDLSPQDQFDFEQSEDFKVYQKILDATDTLKPPSSDLDRIEMELLEKIPFETGTSDNKKGRVIKWPYRVAGIAATALILFGVFRFINSPQQYTSGFGEQLAITLPDNSQVILKPKSVLTFQKRDWLANRTLELNGEAFFIVNKGSDFQVITPKGTVTVLGTEFNVRTTDKMFEVTCTEGIVQVNDKQGKEVKLEKGQGYRQIKENNTTWQFDPERNKSNQNIVCYQLPLEEVLQLLQNQFRIIFKTEGVNLQQNYTGAFNKNNLPLALKTVFDPLGINYEKKGNNTIKLSKKIN